MPPKVGFQDIPMNELLINHFTGCSSHSGCGHSQAKIVSQYSSIFTKNPSHDI